MDDYVEQNDISDDVSYDVSIDDSDVLETDEIIDGVEVNESMESFDDTTEENVEFEEDSINIETDESEDNIVDIPEDTITEDEALEEGREEFLEDVVAENESASEYEQEEILEDTFTEEELSSENEQENLVAEGLSDNSVHFAIEEFDEIPLDDSADNDSVLNDGTEEKIIYETEVAESNFGLEENENSAKIPGEEESNNVKVKSDLVNATIEEENIDEAEIMDFQNDIEEIEVIDNAISETVNSETVEVDEELENSEESDEGSDVTTDETDGFQDTDSDDNGESNESFDTDEATTDENNDIDSDVETIKEQGEDADKITLEDSGIPNASDTGNIDISQDIARVEVDTDNIDVGDSANTEQSLRDRAIHPSIGQTIKIAKNMGDTLKADDEGFQTVKGYRVGKASQFLNSVASTIAQTAPGQKIVDKSLLSDAAHVFDARHATMHPEEKFDFRTPSDVSVDEKAAHTLEVKMPSISYNIDEKALENIDKQDSVLDSEGYKARIDVTPINKGLWINENGLEGIRGESKWCPNDANVQQELNKFGINGIEYKNGHPDFTSVSFFGCNLEESEFLDSDRTQFDGCNFTLLNEIEDDPEFAKLYNFDDEQMEDLESGKTPYGYTWHHDTSEKGFMLLVPTSIHQACRHSGGRSSWGGGSKNR